MNRDVFFFQCKRGESNHNSEIQMCPHRVYRGREYTERTRVSDPFHHIGVHVISVPKIDISKTYHQYLLHHYTPLQEHHFHPSNFI